MPKYYEYKVCGYYLYYTSHCVIEAMHVHASDRKLTEVGSAKFFVKKDGETTIENEGQLTDREIRMIREFIKDNYKEMYMKWAQKVTTDFMENKISLLILDLWNRRGTFTHNWSGIKKLKINCSHVLVNDLTRGYEISKVCML